MAERHSQKEGGRGQPEKKEATEQKKLKKRKQERRQEDRRRQEGKTRRENESRKKKGNASTWIRRNMMTSGDETMEEMDGGEEPHDRQTDRHYSTDSTHLKQEDWENRKTGRKESNMDAKERDQPSNRKMDGT